MAELTAEIVRTIVKEEISKEVSGLKGEVSGLKGEVTSLKGEVSGLRAEMREGFGKVEKEFVNVRQEMHDGFSQVLNTIQGLIDEDRDEMSGLKGRLHNHNERIAKLERLNGLR